MICPQYYVKVTDDLIYSWTVALNDIDSKYIAKATASVLRDKYFEYMPKTNQFRELCFKIKRTEDSTAETKQNPIVDNYSRNKEISTTEARRIQQAIKKGLPIFNKIDVQKIDMVEYLSPEGKTEKIVAYDHVNLEDFESNCANQFLVMLKRKFHGFHREEKRYSKITGEYRVMVQCASNSGGAPVTIGIV